MVAKYAEDAETIMKLHKTQHPADSGNYTILRELNIKVISFHEAQALAKLADELNQLGVVETVRRLEDQKKENPEIST